MLLPQGPIAGPFNGLHRLLVLVLVLVLVLALVLVLVLVEQMLRHWKRSSRYTKQTIQFPPASKRRREIRERQPPNITQRVQGIFQGLKLQTAAESSRFHRSRLIGVVGMERWKAQRPVPGLHVRFCVFMHPKTRRHRLWRRRFTPL